MAFRPETDKLVIEVTPRQLALIRVACLQRLDRIKDRDDCGTSYAETREMLLATGCLHPRVKREVIKS